MHTTPRARPVLTAFTLIGLLGALCLPVAAQATSLATAADDSQTLVADSPVNTRIRQLPPVQLDVPEPDSLALVGLALGLAVAARVRRRQAKG